jgi:hypothetical protein
LSKVFNQIKSRGPDSIPVRVLRAFSEHLAGIFTVIFNLSMSQSVIPTSFKMTTIIPVPKNSKAYCHNDYRHVALTTVNMKCFERLVMAHISSIIPDTLDPLQFVHHPNRPINNTISIALHIALTHLDNRNTYVRIQFTDYSSAFNTIVPSKLITKLRTLGLNTSLCN